jgi:hypothetical protein
MSFAVDKSGDTHCWGENKHNQLQLQQNEYEKTIPSTDQPTKIRYPDFFQQPGSLNILVNNVGNMTMYEAKRPVKSVASET